VKAAQPLIPKTAEAIHGDVVWQLHMYTRELPIYIPDRWLAVSLNLRSARDSFSPISRSEERGAIWFLFWWLFLHRRLRSRQRGLCPKTQATCGYFEADHFPESATAFLSASLKKILRFPEAKPFGFSAECDSCNSRLLPLSSDASPQRLPFSSLVTTPLSTATG